jgi:hypothetical protein
LSFPKFRSLVILLAALASLSGAALAQSSDPDFPTAITSNELSGTIRPRDLGDSRTTTYYYAFEGGQGDIFINIVSQNLSGDIDVFTQSGLRPLTKIVIYPDADRSETGRLLYLRKPEKLILRIQGRTPGDEPASFQIKFAGSFVALAGDKDDAAPKVESSTDTGVTVNSVGTIIATRPKPRPTPKSTPAAETEAVKEKVNDEEVATSVPEKDTVKKPVVIVKDYPGTSVTSPAKKKPVTRSATSTPARRRPVTRPATAKAKPQPKVEEPKESAPNPLAGVRLVVTLKDGNVVEKMLTDLVRFSFDKGILTIIAKDGTISRYLMVDVSQVNVQ